MYPGPYCAADDVLGAGRVQRLQHLDLLVPHRLGGEVDRRLHRGQRDELEEVVLDDVADGAGTLVVVGAPFDPERLGDRDLHVVDELTVPDRLEDPVREAQDQHVLDRLLTEVVVDPEDLLLGEVPVDDLVQVLRGLEVVAERLLDDHARPALGRAALAHLDDDRLDRRGRHGQVVDAVGGRAELLVELVQALHDVLLAALVGEVGRHVADRLGELVPDVLAELVARVVLDRLLHLLPELLVAHLGARNADDAELRRQQVAERERVERREELALRQVAGGAEDRQRARLRRAPSAQPLLERVRRLDFLRDAHSLFTAWPPNWLRSAALIFAANDSSSRDAKRAKSAALITGAGTLSLIASKTVQRPSPESST